MTVYTYGFGNMELRDQAGDDDRMVTYNDCEFDGKTYAVGKSEETGKLLAVYEQADGTKYGVFEE